MRGDYELPERKMVLAAVHPGDCVIELGTSIGVLAAVIASQLGESGRLVSVEASLTLTQQATQLLMPWQNATVVQGFGFPVWNLDEGISVKSFDETRASVGGLVQLGFGNQSTGRSTNGTTLDLSRICQNFGLDPVVLVCDIEGSEAVIALGAPNWPISLLHVIIEIHPNLLPAQVTYSAIVSQFSAEGFALRERDGLAHWFERVTNPGSIEAR